jgi:hypothetical protein
MISPRNDLAANGHETDLGNLDAKTTRFRPLQGSRTAGSA